MVQYQVSSIEMQTKEIGSSFNMVIICNARTHRTVVHIQVDRWARRLPLSRWQHCTHIFLIFLHTPSDNLK